MEWRKIDTYVCEREGGAISLFCGPHTRPVVGYGYLNKADEKYFIDLNYVTLGTPTHWAPLPAHPPEFES